MLRVISGSAKGLKLKTLKGNAIARPTSDRVKESLFSIITNYIVNARVLDLYGGTGNLGIEALSRGAKRATFVDRNRKSIEIIRENLIKTGLIDKGSIIKGEAINALIDFSKRKEKFDIIFLDPPYEKKMVEKVLEIIDKENLLADKGIISTETSKIERIPIEIGSLKQIKHKEYGNTLLLFYENKPKKE